MLTKDHIEEQIRRNSKRLTACGINKIGLFGSYVRQEQRESSDIDILIDFKDGEETFDNFMAACMLLDTLFTDRHVEVVTAKGLSPYIGPHILNSVEYVQITG